MTDSEWLATAFEEHRDHLRAVAYRLLGSSSDADDAVQDTWLKLTGADSREVENLGGWLTTVVARVSLNMLRSRRYRHEEPVGGAWPGAAEVARLSAALPSVERPSGAAWVFHRDRVRRQGRPARSPAVRFARAMARLRIASP